MGCCSFSLLGWLLLGPLASPPAAEPPQRVQVTLLVIFASDRGKHIEPLIHCIAEEVRKRNPQWTNFRLDSLMHRSLAVKETATFKVVDKEQVRLVLRQGIDPQQKVELAVTPPCQGEIIYRTVCGKFLPIVTRCRNERGERLILAIRVQPCPGAAHPPE